MHTMRYIPPSTGEKLVILQSEMIRTIVLDAKAEWTIGRSVPNNYPDIDIQSIIVSRQHGTLTKSDDQWFFSCNPNNTNPTYINGEAIYTRPDEERRAIPLKVGDVLRIDSVDLRRPDERGVLLLFTSGRSAGQWTLYPLARRSVTLIGRDPARCDIVQPLPYISAIHARIDRKRGVYYISDNGSRSGTWLNNRRVDKPVPLREKDRIAICDCSFIFTSGCLVYEQREPAEMTVCSRPLRYEDKPVILKANIASKQVRNNSGAGMKELIRHINLELREGTLVALLGTAGAGKSTVMNCLNGMDTQGVQGSIMYMDQDLIENFGRLQYLIGSVPQNKTFHPTYTPEQEFTDAAILRLPRDTTREEIRRRVDNTISMLRMEGVRNTQNRKLSGGEQTRVNVGIELVADRQLLCLDEPDAGLSPNLKHELFEILRKLAHENNKCILTIIHDVSEIDLFDQVIMLVKVDNVGRLAFSGTPQQARERFGVEMREVYSVLESAPEKYVED